MKKLKYVVFGLIVLLAILTRFYNLRESGTFFWDQAYDLTRIQEYFQNKKISLIGPISEDGSKVYSSLYYYAIMPAAVIFKFSTESTTIGAAFYGIITMILLWWIVFKNNKDKLNVLVWGGLLSIWFPLVETSRWAWNPNLVIFWISLGLVLYQKKGWGWQLVAGVLMGLSIHQHYLAGIAVFIFVLAHLFTAGFKKMGILLTGLLFSLSPFVIFDLTHPPGLFLSRVLYFNQTEIGTKASSVFVKIFNNLVETLSYYSHSGILVAMLLVLIIGLIWIDLRSKPKNLLFFVPWIGQIAGVSFFNAGYSHYFLGGLPFFIYWLSIKRESRVPRLVVVLLLIGSAMTISSQVMVNPWSKPQWQPNISTVDKMDNWIESEYAKIKPEKINIAVLGSSDSNTYGWKYRSLLSLKGILFEAKENYDNADYLFVVSESEEDKIRTDPAFEMQNFREGELVSEKKIDDSNWRVYLFRKSDGKKRTKN